MYQYFNSADTMISFPLHPESKFKIYWEIYILIITVVLTIISPLQIVFPSINSSFTVFIDSIGSFTFFSDIVIKFNTGLIRRQILVTDQKKIAMHYLKGLFVFDVIAALPFVWILAHSHGVLIEKLLSYFLLFRLFKLVSITKTLNRAHKLRFIKPAFIRLILLVFWILIAAHLITCGWVFIEGPGKSSISSTSPDIVYLEAFYWTVTTLTTIGYGDITPIYPVQYFYVIIVMLIGAALYGFIIGNIANIISNIDIAKSQFRDKVENVSIFLQHRSIPGNLQTRIKNYYDYLWESRRGYEESNLLSDLPVSLKAQVSFFLNQDIIEKVPMFKNASRELIRDIVLNLKPVIYTPDDIIIRYGEVGYEMYFINRGEVDVLNEECSIVYATLTSGRFFGEMALLLSSPRTATVKARAYCDIYVLAKETFDKILQRYPDFAKDIAAQAEENRRKLDQINEEKNPEGK